jgi:hypothetical protein
MKVKFTCCATKHLNGTTQWFLLSPEVSNHHPRRNAVCTHWQLVIPHFLSTRLALMQPLVYYQLLQICLSWMFPVP